MQLKFTTQILPLLCVMRSYKKNVSINIYVYVCRTEMHQTATTTTNSTHKHKISMRLLQNVKNKRQIEAD